MKIVVVGGGASGMMAALISAKEGAQVTLIEKNEKTGKKLYITGKGRCNLLNLCSKTEFLDNVVTNSKFLFSAIHKFSPEDAYSFFEKMLPLKVERGNRVFPLSDKSSDVLKAFSRALKRYSVKVVLNCNVLAIDGEEYAYTVKTDGGEYSADRVIVATGGKSYPSTGSTGDGLIFAQSAGLEVTKTYPALCPLYVKEDVKSLEGLSLKNVSLTAFCGQKEVVSEFGEMLFTDKGISGPIALTVSSYVNKLDGVTLSLDLKPALNNEVLDKRLIRELDNPDRKFLKSVLRSLMPMRLVEFVMTRAGFKKDKPTGEITKAERGKILSVLKGLKFTVSKVGDYNCAVVTSGGVSVKELTPCCEAKKKKGLYFVGETIDVDALTGGFNLQAAFSTAYAAATSASHDGNRQ